MAATYYKKPALRVVFLASIFLVLAAFAAATSENDELEAAAAKIQLKLGSAFRAPYIVPPNGGIAWEKLKRLESRLNIDFTFAEMPAARAIALADHGVLDGDFLRVEAVGLTHPNLIRVPHVFAVHDIAVFSWRPELQVNSFEELETFEDYVIATKIGRKFLESKTQNLKNHLLVTELDQLFKLLEARRSDFVLLDRMSAYTALGDRLGKTIFEVSPKPLISLKLYLYLNKKHAALVPEIMQAVQQIEAANRPH